MHSHRHRHPDRHADTYRQEGCKYGCVRTRICVSVQCVSTERVDVPLCIHHLAQLGAHSLEQFVPASQQQRDVEGSADLRAKDVIQVLTITLEDITASGTERKADTSKGSHKNM